MILYLFIVAFLLITLINEVRVDEKNRALIVNRGIGSSRKNNQLPLYIIFFVIFWILVSFRSVHIGNDTEEYVAIYKYFINRGIQFDSRYEIGFQYYCLLLGKISENPQFFIIVSSSIFYIGAGFYFYKFSKNPLISLILFFCFCFSISTNIIRQCLAMLICMYSYQLMKREKYIFSVGLTLFASLFHISALLFLFEYLFKFSIKKRFIVFLGVIVVMLFSINGSLLSIILSIFPSYSYYLGGVYEGTGYLSVSIDLIRNSAIFLIIYEAFKRRDDNEGKIAIHNGIVLLLLSSMGYMLNLFTRAAEFFLVVAIIDLTEAFYSQKILKSKYRSIIVMGFVTAMLALFIFILIFRPEWNRLYPYEFWSADNL